MTTNGVEQFKVSTIYQKLQQDISKYPPTEMMLKAELDK